jgi:hypothetical protein
MLQSEVLLASVARKSAEIKHFGDAIHKICDGKSQIFHRLPVKCN